MNLRFAAGLLAGFVLTAASALDLELRNGVCLHDIQLVGPALNGVTLTAAGRFGNRRRVTVSFSAISLSSLFQLRYYLRGNLHPDLDDLQSPGYAAALSSLDLYLRRFSLPSVVMGNDSVFIRLGAPGSWQDCCGPKPAGQVIWQQPAPDQ